jgi:hypothetical protein
MSARMPATRCQKSALSCGALVSRAVHNAMMLPPKRCRMILDWNITGECSEPSREQILQRAGVFEGVPREHAGSE